VIGNLAASGTEIINRLGDEHLATGFPIVYTSADSVFQIAAHEDIIPVEQLYEMCRTARGLLRDEHAVGRVIARPFKGSSGNFIRTSRRHDFSLEPTGETLLDRVKKSGQEVRAIGKIHDIFAGRGTTWSASTKSNADGIRQTIEQLKHNFDGLLFTNLVDFDSLFGHRNDVPGYAGALMEFDRSLPDIIDALRPDDLLFITADHGCDPAFPGTDHTREFVPLLIYGQKVKSDTDLGTLNGFGAVAATAANYLGLDFLDFGTSCLNLIRK
jgi:phosphopentomutase